MLKALRFDVANENCHLWAIRHRFESLLLLLLLRRLLLLLLLFCCADPVSAINAVCNKSRLQLVRVYDFRLRGRHFSAS